METALARRIAIAALETRRELTDLLEMLHPHIDGQEYSGYSKATANVDAQIKELLDTLFSDHPEVKKDVDEKIKKYGELL